MSCVNYLSIFMNHLTPIYKDEFEASKIKKTNV